VETAGDVAVVHGEDELFGRAGHLFAGCQDFACAANDVHTWTMSQRASLNDRTTRPRSIRKLYRPSVLLDATQRQHVEQIKTLSATIRITPDELNETIILDDKVAVLAGEKLSGVRSYGIVVRPEVVRSVTSLFNAAWRTAMGIEVYEANLAEVRQLAPQILDMLTSGCKDETAARTLGMSLRTYRRRVADLMTALGATSRFQAGVRARELGLV
jgi:DNA-binding NarL/FixJ family response regulator